VFTGMPRSRTGAASPPWRRSSRAARSSWLPAPRAAVFFVARLRPAGTMALFRSWRCRHAQRPVPARGLRQVPHPAAARPGRRGRGGTGSVWRAQATELARLVALKVPHLDPGGGGEVLARFRREGRAAAALRHPNICPLYEVGQLGEVPYLAMAFIEGQPLSA